MNVLYYQTNHKADGACLSAMRALGCQAEPFSCPLGTKEQEERFLPLIRQLLRESHADAIYSFEYFPALSDVCLREKILYISYCCDALTLAMFSANLGNECNRILTADSVMVEEFRKKGAKECYYLPLAPILTREPYRSHFEKRCEEKDAGEFAGKIIFAGSLHEDNLYQSFSKLPDMMRGYLDGITAAQVHIYGYSLFQELMANDFGDVLMRNFSLGKEMEDKEKYHYVIQHYFLEQQTTKLERSMAIKRLAECHKENFIFYAKGTCSISEIQTQDLQAQNPQMQNSQMQNPQAQNPQAYHLQVRNLSYGEDLAEVYQNSAIALNITNRARTSGVPQNAWDILGCGGFLLSNYQADFEELLEAGKDFVLYGSMEELMDLTKYYLEHPEKRIEIAKNGQAKVRVEHTWIERAGAILSLI